MRRQSTQKAGGAGVGRMVPPGWVRGPRSGVLVTLVPGGLVRLVLDVGDIRTWWVSGTHSGVLVTVTPWGSFWVLVTLALRWSEWSSAVTVMKY